MWPVVVPRRDRPAPGPTRRSGALFAAGTSQTRMVRSAAALTTFCPSTANTTDGPPHCAEERFFLKQRRWLMAAGQLAVWRGDRARRRDRPARGSGRRDSSPSTGAPRRRRQPATAVRSCSTDGGVSWRCRSSFWINVPPGTAPCRSAGSRSTAERVQIRRMSAPCGSSSCSGAM